MYGLGKNREPGAKPGRNRRCKRRGRTRIGVPEGTTSPTLTYSGTYISSSSVPQSPPKITSSTITLADTQSVKVYSMSRVNPNMQLYTVQANYVFNVVASGAVTAAKLTFTTNLSTTPFTYTVDQAASALTVAATISDSGAVTYQWHSNTVNSTDGGTELTDAQSNYISSINGLSQFDGGVLSGIEERVIAILKGIKYYEIRFLKGRCKKMCIFAGAQMTVVRMMPVIHPISRDKYVLSDKLNDSNPEKAHLYY